MVFANLYTVINFNTIVHHHFRLVSKKALVLLPNENLLDRIPFKSL